MLTSMFRRILIVYVSVIVIAFALLSLVIHVEIRHYLVEQRFSVLHRDAEILLPEIEQANRFPQVTVRFKKQLVRFKQRDDATVNLLLLDRRNELKKIQQLSHQLIQNRDIYNTSAVKAVVNGKTVQIVGPFSKVNRESMFTLGLPIRSQGIIIGVLFLHTPIQSLQANQVTQITFLIAIPILLITISILYYFSRKFSIPLLQMTRAVQLIGRGNFKQRLSIQSKDEVGQLAATFNQMAIQLSRLEDMRKDLIANVSHEIRTPLTSVRGFVQGILEGVIPPSEQKKYLEISFKELNRLNNILNSMLDLSAIETGQITLDCHPIAWTPIVQHVVDSLRSRAEQKGLEMNVMTTANEVEIWGDAERLTQILINLLDNAIRHTSTGRIEVMSFEQNQRLLVRISDTGEGIPPEMINHIWDRFFTGTPSRSSDGARTGLGLTISKHLIENMHGTIEVESTVGHGTTFTLCFPAYPHQAIHG